MFLFLNFGQLFWLNPANYGLCIRYSISIPHWFVIAFGQTNEFEGHPFHSDLLILESNCICLTLLVASSDKYLTPLLPSTKMLNNFNFTSAVIERFCMSMNCIWRSSNFGSSINLHSSQSFLQLSRAMSIFANIYLVFVAAEPAVSLNLA
jgi:hypothetical protein